MIVEPSEEVASVKVTESSFTVTSSAPFRNSALSASFASSEAVETDVSASVSVSVSVFSDESASVSASVSVSFYDGTFP